MQHRYLRLTLVAAATVASVAPALAALLHSPSVNEKATAFGLQPRPKQISVCFYGDALTSQAPRVQEFRDALEGHTEAAANVDFVGFGTCAAPTTGTCGADNHACDQYPGDIRIALDGTTKAGVAVTRRIPATFTDCEDLGAWSSWSHFPDRIDNSARRACPYNAAVGNDADSKGTRYLDHVLHEIGGHGMGLQHEFLHPGFFNVTGPNGNLCDNSKTKPDTPWAWTPTAVDVLSVMQYQHLQCGIEGNYSHDGYSAWDKLALHILYPEDSRVAEWTGVTLVKTGATVSLDSTLVLRGALPKKVFKSIKWRLGGTSSEGPSLQTKFFSPGTFQGDLTYVDHFGRQFTAPIEVRVATPEAFNQTVGGATAAAAL